MKRLCALIMLVACGVAHAQTPNVKSFDTNNFNWVAGQSRMRLQSTQSLSGLYLTNMGMTITRPAGATSYVYASQIDVDRVTLDPRNYGMVDPTGVQDSYAAIQACFNAASDGAVIELPEGIIKVSQSINVPGNAYPPIYRDWITIRGRGVMSTIIQGDDEDYPVLDLAGAARVHLSDLTIWGLDNKPSCGILTGRLAGDASAGEHKFSNIRIVGNFKVASYFSLSSEVVDHYSCFYTTDSPTNPADVVVLASQPWTGIQSRYKTLGSGSGGNGVHNFWGGVITANLQSAGAAGKAASLLVAEYAQSISLRSVVFASQGITNQIRLKGAVEGFVMENSRQEYTETAEPTGIRLQYDSTNNSGFFYGFKVQANRNLPIYADTGTWLANSTLTPNIWFSTNCANPMVADLWNMHSVNFVFHGKVGEIVVAGCLTNAVVNVRGPVNYDNWTRENFMYQGIMNLSNRVDIGMLNVNTNARVQAYLTVGSTNQTEADIGAVREDASEIMLQVPDKKWYLQVIDSSAGGDASILFRNMTESRDVMRIFPGGNVNIQNGFLGLGIGTNAPANAIDIAFTNSAAIALESTGPGGVEWYLQTGNTSVGLGGAFRLYNNSVGATPFQITGFGDATFLGNIRSSGGTIAGKDGFLIKTTDYPVTTSDAGYTFSNEGAVGLVTMTLPTPAAGLRYTFYVRNAVGFKVAANAAGQTVRIAGSLSTSGGYIDSTTVGDSVTLIALNSTEWGATSIVGAGWAAH